MNMSERIYHAFLMLRAVAYYLVLAFSTVIFTFLLVLSLPLPYHKGRLPVSRAWSKLARNAGKWLCGMDCTIIGRENYPATPAIYVCKHQSAWETIALAGILPPNCFVAKQSLLNIPVFGWGMRLCKHIPIDRSAGLSALKKILKIGKARLEEDKLSIVIFPEGTRVAPKNHPKFYKTAMMLAKETGAAVVPVAHNSGSCWRRNSFVKYPGRITVVIGKPISTEHLSLAELNDLTYEWIKQEMLKLEP